MRLLPIPIMSEQKTTTGILAWQRLKWLLAATVVIGIVTSVVNWMTMPDTDRLFARDVGAYFELEEYSGDSDVDIIYEERFLAELPAKARQRLIREFRLRHPGIRELDIETRYDLGSQFRRDGLDRDTLELTAHRKDSFGGCTIRTGKRFYSTTGIGHSRAISNRYVWLFGWRTIETRHANGSMRGVAREGVEHKMPWRHLPSNPDYEPIGHDGKKFDEVYPDHQKEFLDRFEEKE